MTDETQEPEPWGPEDPETGPGPVEGKRGPGRPKGSRNRPKAPSPEVANRDLTPEEALAFKRQKALALLEENTKLHERHKEELLHEEYGDDQYYVRCDRCSRPGVFLTSYPVNHHVGQDGWFATYKPEGIPYLSHLIKCQCCDARLRVQPNRQRLGEFYFLQGQRRFIDSDERQEKRRAEAKRERDAIMAMKGVPTISVSPVTRTREA